MAARRRVAGRSRSGLPAAVGLLCTLVPLALVSGLAGCAHSVGPTPPLGPTGGSSSAGPPAGSGASGGPSSQASSTDRPAGAAQGQRPITLPVTIGISFQHPAPADQTEQQILYTVQQAMSSLLHAEYGPGGADPLLAEYWSDGALGRAQQQAASWTAAYRQPVGVVALTRTNYTRPSADSGGSTATVSLCEGWQDVSEGNALTHVVDQPVQAPGTPGTFTVLTLTQTSDGYWTVSQEVQTARSLRCAASK
ncbi:MAG TPA: hypothetical protein VGM10_33250 [Actinocrinis sp.]|jgi:hypothetical protein